jgi:hypothetical protein
MVVLALLVWLAQGPTDTLGQRPLTLQSLQPLEQLLVLEVQVLAVREERAAGYLGGARVLQVTAGEVEVAIDLAEATLEPLRPGEWELHLPQPKARRPRVDHERSHTVLATQTGLWAALPGGEEVTQRLSDRGYWQAQGALLAAVKDAHVQQARGHAERVLQGFGRQQGVRLQIVWQSRRTP